MLSSDKILIQKLELASTVVVSPMQFPDDKFRQAKWFDMPEGKDFVNALESANGVDLFSDKVQCVGFFRSSSHKFRLAEWAVERAKIVGAMQAVQEIDGYIQSQSFVAYHILLLTGMDVRSFSWDLGEGVSIESISAIQNTTLRKMLEHDFWNPLPGSTVSSVLVCEFQHPITHQQVGNDKAVPAFVIPSGVREAEEKLEDAHLCLALVQRAGFGAQAIASTTVPKDNVPVMRKNPLWKSHTHVKSSGLTRSNPTGYQWMKKDAELALELFTKFRLLDPSSRNHLRVPMQRLNACAASEYIADINSAIDLRIALESLYLSDSSQGELSHRLAMRAAIYSGGDLEKRKLTYETIKSAYILCSKAVHTGKLVAKKGNGKKRADWLTLYHARECVRAAIISMITNQKAMPDWSDMELTGVSN